MWVRSELKAKGKAAMKANYWKCVVTALILGILTATQVASSGGGHSDELDATLQNMDLNVTAILVTVLLVIAGVGAIAALLINIFIVGPVEVGCYNFFLKNSDEPASLSEIIAPFKAGKFVNIWLVSFMSKLFIALWTLLLVIPGIIKSYEYMMVPYILAEDPSVEWRDALAQSKAMMEGQKMAAFVLDLSFLGWHILSNITLGVLGVLYVTPYKESTRAELYKTLKG